MFLFFSVARSAQTSQAERAIQAHNIDGASFNISSIEMEGAAAEKMPTDKILDVSPLALRMSSPFNSSYWLAAS
jgi:hypothetical protein